MAHFQIVRETCISQLYLLFMSLWYRTGIFSPPFIPSDIYPHSFEHFLRNYSFLSPPGGKFFCKGPDSNYLGYADHMVSVTIQLCSRSLHTGIDSRKTQKLGCVLKKKHLFFFFFPQSNQRNRTGMGHYSFPTPDLSCLAILESDHSLCCLQEGRIF